MIIKYYYILLLLLYFSFSIQSQTAIDFDRNYQKSLRLVKYKNDSTRYLYKKMSRSFDKLTSLQKAKLHYLMLRINGRKSEIDSTYILLKRELNQTALKDTLERANLAMQLAKEYDKKEQSHKAIPYYLEAVKLFQSIGKHQLANKCKIDLSEAYRIQDRAKDGIVLLREVFLDNNIKPEDKAYAYNRLATLYNNVQTSPDSTIKYSKKCIEIAKKKKLIKLLALSQNELGHVYNLRLEKKQLAIYYFKKAIYNFYLVDAHRDIINTSINYSNIFIANNEYKKALNIMNKAVDYLTVDYPSRNTRRLFLHLSKIHKLLGNYKEALEFLDLGNLMERLIYFNEVDEKLFEMGAKYNAEAKNKQIVNEKEKNDLLKQRNRLLWLAFALFVIAVFVLGYFLNLKRKYNQQKRVQAEQENKNLQSELELKNKKLAINTLKTLRNTKFEDNLVKEIKEIAKTSKETNKKKLLQLVKNKRIHETTAIWDEFEKSFAEVNLSFYDNLAAKCPNLTKNDKKICAFLKLNMGTKDIASLLNISQRGVETARYRLRKKIELDHDVSLYQFIDGL